MSKKIEGRRKEVDKKGSSQNRGELITCVTTRSLIVDDFGLNAQNNEGIYGSRTRHGSER